MSTHAHSMHSHTSRIFVAIEHRRDEPLVPLGVFRVHNLAASNTVMALLGAAWIPMWFYLNLYLIQGRRAAASVVATEPESVAPSRPDHRKGFCAGRTESAQSPHAELAKDARAGCPGSSRKAANV